MFIPKVRFDLDDLNREAELLLSFSGDKRWASVFEKTYPELKALQENGGNKKGHLEKYKEFVKKQHELKKQEILEFKEKIQSEWNKVGPEFLKLLAENFETDWPTNKTEIIGYVSILPVFPRFLDEYSFCVGYKNVSRMIEVSAHEITHFLWFKKWKEIFPESKRKEYESPNLTWRLSEIMDPIILQCCPAIKELIKPQKWGYSSFEKIKIGQISMTEHFKDVYLKSLAAEENFGVILNKLWDEAQKHESEISQF